MGILSVASERLSILSVVVVIGILLILTTAFRSARDALIIMLNLPLALVGGVLGGYLSGGVLSVASIIGLNTLFGIATRNGIMLVSHIRHLLEAEGVTEDRTDDQRHRASISLPGCPSRPALESMRAPRPAQSSEWAKRVPTRITPSGKSLSSTALNMVVVPAAYFRYRRREGY